MKRVSPAGSLWLPGLLATLVATVAAGQGKSAGQEPAAELYRCRGANGVIALVSKPDPTLSDCVRVWSGSAATGSVPPFQTPAPAPRPEPAPAAVSAPHAETAEEHDARLRAAKTDILQWCRDHQAPDSKASEKAKAKQLDECIQDKFCTYMLLNP